MKTLDEIFKEYEEALAYNKMLLKKCEKGLPPFDGFDADGKPNSGVNSNAYIELYSMVVNTEMAMNDLAKAKAKKLPSVQYKNVVQYEETHRCRSCKYCSHSGKEDICKNPMTNINHVKGGITSNCITKFDSYQHYWLKINPAQIGCKYWKAFDKEEEIA